MSASTTPALPDRARTFRDAMATFAMVTFPSGVTRVTTSDAESRWWGFTATSFCSVSMQPPLVLDCLAETAECHQLPPRFHP